MTELTSKIDVQKGIVQQNGQQYDNLKQKLELQKTAHDQLKTKVEAAKKAYEDSAKATGEDSEETQKLKAEYEKLSSQLSTSESQIAKTETAITKQEAAVNQSKAALTEMEAELKNVNAELARAPFDEYAAKAEKVGGTLTSVGQKLLPLSTSIAGLGVAAVKTTADFDSEMSKCQQFPEQQERILINCEEKPVKWVRKQSSARQKLHRVCSIWQWLDGRRRT